MSPTANGEGNGLVLNTRRVAVSIFLVCIACEILLVFLDYRINYSHATELDPIRRFFNITREDGLASWFAVTQTTMLALTSWLIWWIVGRRGAGRWTRVGWLVLFIFFSYMAFDDGTAFHERMGSVFEETKGRAQAEPDATTLGARALEAFPSYPWQLLFLPMFAALGLFSFLFLWWQSRSSLPRVMVVWAMVCFGSAIGLDFIEGLDPDHRWNAYTWIEKHHNFDQYAGLHFREGTYEACRHFSKSIEEFLEMFANTLLWMVCLTQLGANVHGARLQFAEAGPAPPPPSPA